MFIHSEKHSFVWIQVRHIEQTASLRRVWACPSACAYASSSILPLPKNRNFVFILETCIGIAHLRKGRLPNSSNCSTFPVISTISNVSESLPYSISSSIFSYTIYTLIIGKVSARQNTLVKFLLILLISGHPLRVLGESCHSS